jgi:RimJ/RimL family protein N-acetyltransferase
MEISQRSVTLFDADVLLSWRNDPSARDLSVNSEKISSIEHLQWFSARLKRIRLEPFFLFEVNQKVVGMSRLDSIPDDTGKYEISILVDPNQRGGGIGRQILKMTCESFFSIYGDKMITAKVHKKNIISQKLFIGAGFMLINSVSDFLSFEKSYKI